jgi:hypothetical protein
MPSLGEMLKARIERDEEAERQRVAAVEDEQIATAQANRKLIEMYFAFAQAGIEKAITRGTAIPCITLGKSGDGTYALATTILKTYQWGSTPQGSIQDASHPYYDVWAKFRDWANENGLNVGFEYDHDGMGRESWYILTVKPQ